MEGGKVMYTQKSWQDGEGSRPQSGSSSVGGRHAASMNSVHSVEGRKKTDRKKAGKKGKSKGDGRNTPLHNDERRKDRSVGDVLPIQSEHTVGHKQEEIEKWGIERAASGSIGLEPSETQASMAADVLEWRKKREDAMLEEYGGVLM